MKEKGARALLIAALLFFGGCREQILHNLSEIDVTRIESRLEGQGISATRERQPDGRWTLSVHSDDSSRAVQLIESHRLLRESRGPEEGKSSMLASREDQRFHYERSLSRELESTLGTLAGVLEARVHLNMPPLDPIFGQPIAQTKGTASVLLIVSAEFAAQASEVAAIISGAAGIPAEGVSVLLSRSAEPTAAAAVATVAASEPAKPIEAAVVAAVQPSGGFSSWSAERVIEIAVSLLILGIGLVLLSRSRRLRPFKLPRAGAPSPTMSGVKHAA